MGARATVGWKLCEKRRMGFTVNGPLATLLTGLVVCRGAAAAQTRVSVVVEADSVLQAGRFAAWNLVDGDRVDPESRWASARTGEPHWVTLQFAAPVPLDRAVVYGHREADLVLLAADFQVKRSGQWQTVTSVEENEQPAEATAQWARRVRLEVDGDTAVCRIGNRSFRVSFDQDASSR